MKKSIAIFLDVDGVLNNINELYYIQEKNKKELEKLPEVSPYCSKKSIYNLLDATEYHVKALDLIVIDLKEKGYDVDIIVSSSWRYKNCKEWFSSQLERLGSTVSYKHIIGETPKITDKLVERCDEIFAYLKMCGKKYSTFLILDDCPDMRDLAIYHYHIDPYIGLVKQDSKIICEMVDKTVFYNNLQSTFNKYDVSVDSFRNEWGVIEKIYIHCNNDESVKPYINLYKDMCHAWNMDLAVELYNNQGAMTIEKPLEI